MDESTQKIKQARKPSRGWKLLMALATPTFLAGVTALGIRPTAAQTGPSEQESQLGKALFFEKNLSNPAGMACATCHSPMAGFSYPDSDVNQVTGTVPGADTNRFGNRKPPTVSYARFIPEGPPTFDTKENAYVGGLFFDGRALNLAHQAEFPLTNPNEMNNLVHNIGSPSLVVQEIERGPNAVLFEQVWGSKVFDQPTSQVFQLAVQSIAAWESSKEVSPFASKYDAYLAGKASLTPAELDGLRLFTGTYSGRPGGVPYVKSAECSSCHVLAPAAGQGPDLFTDSHYYNIGVPRNEMNPYYEQTNSTEDPVGYNPLGDNYIDYGLGDYLYPDGGVGVADTKAIKGTFKAPTLRNVDARPAPTFVKDYCHNGFFKSLQEVVHFYNTRNLTTVPGEVIDFTRANPYLGLRGEPLWPTPEYPSPLTLINPAGHATGPGRHLGNLGLSPTQETDLVAFLRTLTDASPQQQGPP